MAYRLALKYCVPIITISNDIQEFIPMEKSNGNIKDISTAVTTLTHKYHELKEKNISSLDSRSFQVTRKKITVSSVLLLPSMTT